MKRDYITLIAGLAMLGAVGLLFLSQITLFRNPLFSELPNQTANIAAPTVGVQPTIILTGIVTSAVLGGRANAMLLNAPLPIANVTIQNFLYTASSLTVPVGTTVKWTQRDKEPHTVSAGTPAKRDRSSAFNSGTLTTVGVTTYEFTFQKPGFYPYFCVYHPQMLGEIIVQDPQAETPTLTPPKPTAAATTTPRPATTRPTLTAAATPRSPSTTPQSAALPTSARIVATGLINPRGFTKGPDGALYVAEAGTVPVVATLVAPITPPFARTPTVVATLVAPATRSGRISRIAPDGTRTTIASNLPATVGPFNDVFGVNSVAFVGDDLYTIIAAGATRGHPDFPTGVYRVANAKTTLVADLEKFQKQNPPKFIPDDYDYSLPYDLVSQNGKLYITDGNAAVVFEVDPSLPLGRNIKRIVDLSATHNVLTGISAGANGAIYFIGFTPASYPVGSAQVFKWTPQGGLSTVTKGLSLSTSIALAPDGTIYASEFATDLAKPPAIVPPGRVVKIGTNGKIETVATPLVYPTVLRWLDGALYVTNNGVNAVEGGEGKGEILRLKAP